MENMVYWFEICFYGDEDEESERYVPEKACSYVVKFDRVTPYWTAFNNALEVLLRGWSYPDEAEELRRNCTNVFECSEEEAKFFDVDDLTKRVTDDLGTYYVRGL